MLFLVLHYLPLCGVLENLLCPRALKFNGHALWVLGLASLASTLETTSYGSGNCLAAFLPSDAQRPLVAESENGGQGG